MADDKKLHIVMFPWLAFGHMIPYLELSKLIAEKGHRVSFISTPRNIKRLPTKIPPHLAPYLNFVKIPLPQDDGLPQDAEATSDLPYDKVQFLKKAFDGLKQPLFDFLQTSDADWILHDFAPYWLSKEMGPTLGIKTAFFSIYPPHCLVIIGPMFGDCRTKPEDFTVLPDWVPFPSTVMFRYFEIVRIFDGMFDNVSGISDTDRLKMSAHYSDLVVVRGCPQFGQEWIQLLGDVYGKTILPVGQLPRSEYDSGDDNPSWRSIKEWLDQQSQASVIYVAFGSEAKPSQDELTEIALGLEKSELPFFWVFKTRRGPSDPDPIELPKGFEERTKGRGVVWTSWAPQLKILSHESVGGFLTHTGWSSIVEGVQSEKALIFLTFLSDQGINARLLEEKKMGYSIPRNELDGSFTGDSVAESLKLVMSEEGGKIYRESIKAMTLHADASFTLTPVDAVVLTAVDEATKEEWMKRIGSWRRYGWRATTLLAADADHWTKLQESLSHWQKTQTAGEPLSELRQRSSRRRYYRSTVGPAGDDVQPSDSNAWFSMHVVRTHI